MEIFLDYQDNVILLEEQKLSLSDQTFLVMIG